MCFSSPKSPAPTPLPPPAPTPIAAESNIGADAARRTQLEKLRMGLASTIKTSPRGLTGSGANLVGSTTTGKKTLGA